MKLSKKKQADLAKKHKTFQPASQKRWRVIQNDMPAEYMTRRVRSAPR